MTDKLRRHWKSMLTLALGLAVVCTLTWAWVAKSEFTRHRSRGTGLTTLDHDALKQSEGMTPNPTTSQPPPLVQTPDPLDSLLLPPGGMTFPADSLWATLPGVGGDIDIQILADRLVIELAVPNLNEASVQIEADRQSLRVAGQQETVQEERDATGQVVSTSRSSSSYSTSFSLPEPVQPDGLKSHYDSGRLHIEIPRLYNET